jgi:hypothetical protein
MPVEGAQDDGCALQSKQWADRLYISLSAYFSLNARGAHCLTVLRSNKRYIRLTTLNYFSGYPTWKRTYKHVERTIRDEKARGAVLSGADRQTVSVTTILAAGHSKLPCPNKISEAERLRCRWTGRIPFKNLENKTDASAKELIACSID